MCGGGGGGRGGWCVQLHVCVLEGLPCCQTDLHEKGRSNYITYANKECTHAHTYIHTTDGLLLRSKRQCERSFLGWHHHLSETDLTNTMDVSIHSSR